MIQDRHVPVDHELPRVDDVPNYNLISAVETDTATIIRFTRAFDTCDLDQDYYITVSIHYLMESCPTV